MALPSPLRSWLPGALMLAALLPASWAAGADSGDAGRSSSSIERLKRDVGRPEDFQRYIDGSRDRQGGPDDPRFGAQPGAAGPSAGLRLSPSPSGPRLEGRDIPEAAAAAPAAPAPAAPRSSSVPSQPFYVRLANSPLPLRKLSAVLGLGFMLIAGSMLETPPEHEPEPEPFEEFPDSLPLSPRAPLAAPELEFAPTRFANALAERAFIDTRMPAPTWRAISRREQELIDAWDASPEKSLGQSSLEDWVASRGAAAGVDVPLLQAKLKRDA